MICIRIFDPEIVFNPTCGVEVKVKLLLCNTKTVSVVIEDHFPFSVFLGLVYFNLQSHRGHKLSKITKQHSCLAQTNLKSEIEVFVQL